MLDFWAKTVHGCGCINGLKIQRNIICSILSVKEKLHEMLLNQHLHQVCNKQLAAENCLMRHLVHSLNTRNAAQNKTAYILNINCLSKGKKRHFHFLTHTMFFFSNVLKKLI